MWASNWGWGGISLEEVVCRNNPNSRGSAWLSLKFGILLSHMGIIGMGWEGVCLSDLLFIVCLANPRVEGKEVAIIVAVRPIQFLKFSNAKPLRSVRRGKIVESQGIL